MSSLTKLGLEKGRVTILVMMIAIIAGFLAYMGFSKREDPSITIRTAIIAAQNSGLTLRQLEELVARPIEETARSIPGVSEIRTQLVDGTAILQVDIDDAVSEEDLKRVFDEIRDDVSETQRQMPEGTLGPIVSTDFGDVAIATIAITGSGFSYREIEDAAKALRNRLYALDEITSVAFHGVRSEVITLEIERERLAVVGKMLSRLGSTLQGQNVRLPAGTIVSADMRVPLRVSGDVKSVDDIKSLLVELPSKGLIRLGDLVKVKEEYQDPPSSMVFQNGQPAILIGVEMAKGVDVTKLGPELEKIVEEFRLTQPIGIEATFSTFQPEIVSASVNGALINMGQTFVVVLITMLFFIGWREALVIASIVPFAVSFAFTLMGPFGVELQQVSIAAIIISLGLLVDNGLVIIEDMERRISAGEKRKEAALAAGGQFTIPLLIASTTTVAAFMPLFLLDGTEGEYGYSLGAVVMLMLTGSFLSALYILPNIAVWALPKPSLGHDKVTFFDRIVRVYGQVIGLCLKAPFVVILIGICFVVLGASQMGKVRNQMFPASERPQFLVYMDMPRGTEIMTTRDIALRFSKWLQSHEKVKGVTSFIGTGGPRFVLSLDPADSNSGSAFMVVQTTSVEATGSIMKEARAKVLSDFPEADFRIKQVAMGGREPGIDVEISGPDADKLLHAAKKVQEAFAEAPGIIQNRNDWGNKIFEGHIEVAQDRLRQYGLTTRDFSNTLNGFFDGAQISVFRKGDDLVPIILRGADDDRTSYEAVSNAIVEAGDQPLSIDQLASLRPSLEFSSIRRVNQRRTIKVTTISDTVTSLALYEHIKPMLKELKRDLGSGYEIAIGGEIENSGEVRQKLGSGFPAAVTVMLIALMIQFNSFRRVAITLLSVPLVITGVPFALLGFDQPLSFFGTLGLIALSGIIINNAIVLIDQIDIERRNLPLDDAIQVASQKRFRPILLTSLTTVIGLVPMAANGGALWEPMATLMIGGLGFASLMTLFWVPALYRLFFRGNTEYASIEPA